MPFVLTCRKRLRHSLGKASTLISWSSSTRPWASGVRSVRAHCSTLWVCLSSSCCSPVLHLLSLPPLSVPSLPLPSPPLLSSVYRPLKWLELHDWLHLKTGYHFSGKYSEAIGGSQCSNKQVTLNLLHTHTPLAQHTHHKHTQFTTACSSTGM